MIERNKRLLLLAMVLALVLVQSLGALHRLLHVGHGVHSQATSWEEKNSFAALWAEHGNASDCQSFDQAAPDVLQSAILATLVMPPPNLRLVMVLQDRFASPERFFAARGPPVALI